MIRYYHKTLRGKKLEVLDEYKAGCWVYVEAPTGEDLDLLVRKFKRVCLNIDTIGCRG